MQLSASYVHDGSGDGASYVAFYDVWHHGHRDHDGNGLRGGSSEYENWNQNFGAYSYPALEDTLPVDERQRQRSIAEETERLNAWR